MKKIFAGLAVTVFVLLNFVRLSGAQSQWNEIVEAAKREGLLLAGCSREGAAPKQGVDDAGSASASFVNKVWRVSASSSVAASTLYILRLSAAEFKIRSNNPRQPVETTLVPAESRALSK